MMEVFPRTAFFGRTQELNNITERLNNPNCRLLTVLGIGGIGKTRLAQSVIDRLAATRRSIALEDHSE